VIRLKFITLLGGVAVAWPLAVNAQQPERMRRIGVLLASTADDPEYKPRMRAFEQALALLGWTDGRNARIDIRWAGTNAEDVRKHAVNWSRSRRT
jgi:putative tryptophan/tyrosine transport system substrate-binding protein